MVASAAPVSPAISSSTARPRRPCLPNRRATVRRAGSSKGPRRSGICRSGSRWRGCKREHAEDDCAAPRRAVGLELRRARSDCTRAGAPRARRNPSRREVATASSIRSAVKLDRPIARILPLAAQRRRTRRGCRRAARSHCPGAGNRGRCCRSRGARSDASQPRAMTSGSSAATYSPSTISPSR